MLTSNGEMFEGGLYAVGEGSVWIDTQYGRMGLSGPRVKSVVQIDAPRGTPALGARRDRKRSVGSNTCASRRPAVFVGKVIDRDARRPRC